MSNNEIFRKRLEMAYQKIIEEIEEEKKFIEKIFNLHRHYMQLATTKKNGAKENFDALSIIIQASIEELSIGFQGCLDTILDLSDLEDETEKETK